MSLHPRALVGFGYTNLGVISSEHMMIFKMLRKDQTTKVDKKNSRGTESWGTPSVSIWDNQEESGRGGWGKAWEVGGKLGGTVLGK